jgi:hypothetical protein
VPSEGVSTVSAADWSCSSFACANTFVSARAFRALVTSVALSAAANVSAFTVTRKRIALRPSGLQPALHSKSSAKNARSTLIV